jgi:hypothetical protein
VRVRVLVQELVQELVQVQVQVQVLAPEQARVPELVQVRVRVLVLVRELVQAREQVDVNRPVPKLERVRAAVITLRHGTCASGPGRSTSPRTMPAIRLIRSKS